jgi:hypothetical protein
MTVPEVFIMQAWEKAGAQCQCRRFSHNHSYGRCTRRLVYEKRGSRERGGWAPRFKTSPTTQTPLSCEILCLDCFQQAELDEFKT